jgi:hypothetical protein
MMKCNNIGKICPLCKKGVITYIKIKNGINSLGVQMFDVPRKA